MSITLQNVDRTEPETFDWGWLRWLMNDRIEPGAPQTVGVCHIEPGHSNPLHYHPNCEELLYVTSGTCEHVLGDDTITMRAGDLIRIPVGVHHRASNPGPEPMEAIIVFSSGDRQTVVVED